jgi:hypothetical protein
MELKVEGVMNKHTRCMGFAAVLGSGLLLGCATAPPSQSPAGQAAAFQQGRCTAQLGEQAVAKILDGSAVERVEPLYSVSSSKTSNSRLLGAAIEVAPVRGETAEWLARSLECHGAQQVMLHASGQPMKSDPFFLPESMVQIDVASAGDGYRVTVSSTSSAEAHEILDRAQALTRGQPERHEGPTASFDVR